MILLGSRLSVLFGFCGVLGLVFGLFALASVPESYSDLSGLPEIPEVPQSFPFGNLTGVPVVDLGHGLNLWLPFDGSVKDKSGYRLDGSVSSAVYGDGVFASGFVFDGSEGVVVSDDVLLNFSDVDFSVSFWYKSDNVGSAQYPVSKRYGSYGWWFYLHSDGLMSFYLRDADSSALNARISGLSLDDDAWHFVVGCRNASSDLAWIFVDVVNNASRDVSLVQSLEQSVDLVVGGFSTSFAVCEIDDLRVYNRVLSLDEIECLFGLGV